MNSTKKIEITWLGQSFFKIVSPAGRVILIDPWIDYPPGNQLFPKNYPVDEADLILVTHGHLDHLGNTVDLAKKMKKVKVVCIFELMIYLMEQGVKQEVIQPMNIGGSVDIDGINITMVRADHSCGIGNFSPKHLKEGGSAAGFVIKLENEKSIYHAGDTSLFSDMKLIAELYSPEIAMLPIGDIFTMGPKEAAYATKLIKPKTVIPMHYGGTFQLPGDPNEFKKLVKGSKVVCLKPGEIIKD